MNCSVISFGVTVGDIDACRGDRTWKEPRQALLLETGEKKVLITSRHGRIRVYLMALNDAGEYRYQPYYADAEGKPKREYSTMRTFVLPDEMGQRIVAMAETDALRDALLAEMHGFLKKSDIHTLES